MASGVPVFSIRITVPFHYCFFLLLLFPLMQDEHLDIWHYV